MSSAIFDVEVSEFGFVPIQRGVSLLAFGVDMYECSLSRWKCLSFGWARCADL